MQNIVHLKWGEEPAAEGLHLMVRRISRSRGDDYFVRPCPDLGGIGEEARSFASLNSALEQAQSVARQCGVDTIYVRLGA